MKKLILLLTALTIANAKASIGETLPQLISRFGNPLKQTSDGFVFDQNGVTITVSMNEKNRAWIVRYDSSNGFSRSEILHLIKVNSQSFQGHWEEPTNIGGVIYSSFIMQPKTMDFIQYQYKPHNGLNTHIEFFRTPIPMPPGS